MNTKNRVNGKAHEMLAFHHLIQNADQYCGCRVGTIAQTSPSLVLSENDFSRIDCTAESDKGQLGIELKWRKEHLYLRYYDEGCYVDAEKLENLFDGYGKNGLFIAFWPVAESVFVWHTTKENMERWRTTLCERELPKDNTSDEVETERVYMLPFGESDSFYIDAVGWECQLDEYTEKIKAANGIQ